MSQRIGKHVIRNGYVESTMDIDVEVVRRLQAGEIKLDDDIRLIECLGSAHPWDGKPHDTWLVHDYSAFQRYCT